MLLKRNKYGFVKPNITLEDVYYTSPKEYRVVDETLLTNNPLTLLDKLSNLVSEHELDCIVTA